MLTVIIKRSDEPTVIQLTQTNVMNELKLVNDSEMLLEDKWSEGLKKVRTPYVCLLEADCLMSGSYIASNVNLLKKMNGVGKNFNGISGGSHGGGGYQKLAMLTSCLGIRSFDNRIYSYRLEKTEEDLGRPEGKKLTIKYWGIQPNRQKMGTDLYPVQVGFVPGAMIKMSSIKSEIDTLPWDSPNLVKLSTAVSFYLWETNRRIEVNPNTTYVSNENYLEKPIQFKFDIHHLVTNTFMSEGIH